MTSLQPGTPWPLGATLAGGGVNLAVWAPDATRIDWCLFDVDGGDEIARWPLPACTDGVWHGLLPGARAGLVYGLRAHGPWAPAAGHRFNPAKLLLDPYAKEVVGAYGGAPGIDLSLYRGDLASDPAQPDERDNATVALKARLPGAEVLDRRLPRPPRPQVPWDQVVLYEVHVKGATQRHPAVPAALRGRYAGLAHPAFIEHVKRLGVTTLNLLPVHARADEARLQGLGLSNYWGYSSIGFFAPEPRYASAAGGPTAEFRAMVDALHAAGLEVVLDVVFNHTAETDELGPTLSFRGLANARYYRLEDRHNAGDRHHYVNWAGCGNVLNLAEPRVVQLVVDSLRHWVEVMGVDGFRFDLAPVLARDGQGAYSRQSAFFAALHADPVLQRVKLIAEPWDLGPGGYQLGAFPPGWREWNDRFRDAMRSFWLRGDHGEAIDRGEFVHRWAGSSNEFGHDGRLPGAGINFLTAHDGFTLRDLLSYNHKHNHANGEHNRDGHHHNASWNCGVEGPSDDPAVQALRLGLTRALLATLLLAHGTPMLLAGDELGHSQQGNNNAYCQDNTLTWLDWSDATAGADADLIATVSRLLALRRSQPALRRPHWLQGAGGEGGNAAWDVQWLAPQGVPLTGAAWQQRGERALAIWLNAPGEGESEALLVINAGTRPVRFHLPPGDWTPAFASQQACGLPPAGQPWRGHTDVPPQSLQVALHPASGRHKERAPPDG
jgi:glycogen operon protein